MSKEKTEIQKSTWLVNSGHTITKKEQELQFLMFESMPFQEKDAATGKLIPLRVGDFPHVTDDGIPEIEVSYALASLRTTGTKRNAKKKVLETIEKLKHQRVIIGKNDYAMYVHIKPKENSFVFGIHPEIVPFLDLSSKGYARINTQNYLELNNISARRLYEQISLSIDQPNFIHHPIPVHDLMIRLGALDKDGNPPPKLDKNGKVKKLNTSSTVKKTFIRRHIAEPIQLIAQHPVLGKQIEFIEHKEIKGNKTTTYLGYKPIYDKQDKRKIEKIQFLYRWKKTQNKADYLKQIINLANKYMHKKPTIKDWKDVLAMLDSISLADHNERTSSIFAKLQKEFEGHKQRLLKEKEAEEEKTTKLDDSEEAKLEDQLLSLFNK
ncbi:RepB family plasmid replication initiator protein (plasmid) [Vibrio sp. SS-MA-C1-2]|uniref:RepB family plasmid replication initiator protein n=1 Tax=Vibrio sp. SS-MA-C1-2 TaxID=2908646 RepID=UPI001F3056E5|nr:RepB family plasmid replication initiator protein [Vibrio sp. SS-MA-C1-2]UJF20237.1 RepB family plasmid replication initiator protein [Vibrio sp. SS-MA-C1-2]